MKRDLYTKLLKWKKDRKRKPLLLQGARQVGKTYLIRQFAQKEYTHFIYLNFEEDANLITLFNKELTPAVLLENIELYIGKKISAQETLLFFDEIQVCAKAITSLKYFQEQVPQYHIIAAGSLLGVSVGNNQSFPVGKINFLTLYPMTFLEYLQGIGENLLVKKINTIEEIKPLQEIIHEKLLHYYKLYLYIGGMPEVIKDYRDYKDIESVRKIQNDILEAYKRDFSKYTNSSQAIKTSELWRSIPYQLAKENKKFKYSDVKKKARASTYETTIEWLKSAGLINIAYNISTPKIPLSGYCDKQKFKLFILDTGLLSAMLNLSSSIVVSPDKIFQEYNGAFIENFVAQELTAQKQKELFYWTSKSEAEVDFIIQNENEVYPLEVKSGSSKNLKSLKSYNEKFNPKFTFRISPRNFIQSDNFINIPLYAIKTFFSFIR